MNSRVLKFRAWNTQKGKANMVQITHGDIGDLVDEPMWRVMQFTGLQDKNGVDIYEGDILSYDGRTLSPVEFEYCEFIARPFALSPQAPNSQEVFEVLGNIHANPELLEQSS